VNEGHKGGSTVNGAATAQEAVGALETLAGNLAGMGFDDSMARQPSMLPGWTVGHVLTHLARNADGYRRMVEAANAGDISLQYPGGDDQRESEIADGAGRPADQLIDDLRASNDALGAAFSQVEPSNWPQAVCRFRDQPWPLFDLPFLRWREVVIHTGDLGLSSLTVADIWPRDYVNRELLRQVVGLTERLVHRQGVVVAPVDQAWSTNVLSTNDGDPSPFAVVAAPSVDILAWLVGRSPGEPTWPEISHWKGIP
jgi:maleylpyruvate isomerase